MEIKFKKSLMFLVACAMIAVIALTGCEAKSTDSQETGSQSGAASANESTASQQGELSFTLEVTDAEGGITRYPVITSEKTVGAALVGAELIEGEETDNGLNVIYVNGERADYDEDGAYWAFYIDGEYATTGVDSTDIEDGKTYAFVYTKA